MHEIRRSSVNFKKLRRLSQLALEMGSLHTKIISVKTIITAPWVSLKCQYSCCKFGVSNICPPDAPTFRDTRAVIDSYEKAILIRGNDKAVVSKIALDTEKEAFISRCYKAFAYYAGPCKLSLEEEESIDFIEDLPKRPFLEGAGIDVFQTVRNNGFRAEIITSPGMTPNYFSLVLVE